MSIAKELVKTGKWSLETAELGVVANFKCEYCGLDLLQSPENYKLWQVDHIIPQHAGGKNSPSNKAISCRQCNMDFKSRWNPAEHIPSDNPTRKELIEFTRKYIQERKQRTQNEIDHVKSLLA